MKKTKRILCVILCALVLLLPLSIVPASADGEYDFPSGGSLNFLVMGDSITEGFGVENSEEAGYARIVADTNGYNYVNLSRVATDTERLIYQIKNTDRFREAIKWADIIHLSIGSNNYLANDRVVLITAGALFGVNDRELDEIAEGIYQDYLIIIDLIRELNPDAKLIFDNVYCSWEGLGRIPFNKAVVRVNNALNRALETNKDEFVIFDLASVINGHGELVAADSTHPNAKGNVEIAKAMLKFLKELGLGENTEPVINAQGIDYNYFVECFGTVAGTLITAIVRVLTLHFQ
ncbi:MAG: SGNH/GDSL hydrolase family protein [Clostridia bacterium]|nr:SGNH/GDSL hydrolase family protein [Clostridia bacterium]